MTELWTQAAAVSAAALASGALEPLETTELHTTDRGVPFGVRVLSSLRRKSQRPPRPGNPFLPPDPDLVVARWGPDHALVLNKFPVFADHLLLITNQFEHQTDLLTGSDIEACISLLHAADGLLFFNGGADAGASQPHRHLQLVRTPLGPGSEPFPTAACIDAGALGVKLLGAPLPADPAEAHSLYLTLLTMLQLKPGDPYNLLATRERIWIIPRRTEHFGSVSVNALGFAGSMLVRTVEEAQALIAAGPLSALQATGVPAGAGRA